MSSRTKSRIVLVLLVLFINLPLAQSTWTRWRVERSGTEVTATLVENEVVGEADEPAYWIAYQLPDDVDPDARPYPARVDRATYDDVVASGQVPVLVLEGERPVARAVGQVVGRAGLVATLVADALLLGFLWVLRRYGRYGRPTVWRLEAVENVVPAPDEGGIDEADSPDGMATVSGEIAEVTDHDVVIDTGARRVVVVLDGHRVEVGPGEPGRVRGRWL